MTNEPLPHIVGKVGSYLLNEGPCRVAESENARLLWLTVFARVFPVLHSKFHESIGVPKL